MTSIVSFFSGRKTYIIGFLTIILGYLNGDNAMVLQGVSVMTLRAAIAKI